MWRARAEPSRTPFPWLPATPASQRSEGRAGPGWGRRDTSPGLGEVSRRPATGPRAFGIWRNTQGLTREQCLLLAFPAQRALVLPNASQTFAPFRTQPTRRRRPRRTVSRLFGCPSSSSERQKGQPCPRPHHWRLGKRGSSCSVCVLEGRRPERLPAQLSCGAVGGSGPALLAAQLLSRADRASQSQGGLCCSPEQLPRTPGLPVPLLPPRSLRLGPLPHRAGPGLNGGAVGTRAQPPAALASAAATPGHASQSSVPARRGAASPRPTETRRRSSRHQAGEAPAGPIVPQNLQGRSAEGRAPRSALPSLSGAASPGHGVTHSKAKKRAQVPRMRKSVR